MTRLETVRFVRDALLKQGQKSINEERSREDGETLCMYRGDNGCKCAIGHLIPDENYKPSLENKPYNDSRVLEAAGLPASLTNAQRRLYSSMQDIHDSRPVDVWPAAFAALEREIIREDGDPCES